MDSKVKKPTASVKNAFVLPKGNSIPSVKKLGICSSGTVSLYLHYDNARELHAPAEINTYTVQHLIYLFSNLFQGDWDALEKFSKEKKPPITINNVTTFERCVKICVC